MRTLADGISAESLLGDVHRGVCEIGCDVDALELCVLVITLRPAGQFRVVRHVDERRGTNSKPGGFDALIRDVRRAKERTRRIDPRPFVPAESAIHHLADQVENLAD